MRNHPLYHLIKARVQKKMGHPEESVSTMQAAMNLPGVKKAGKQIAWEFLRRNSIKHVFRSSLVAVLLFVSGRLGLKNIGSAVAFV